MHDIIFENQTTLSLENILFYASQLGIDTERLQNDMQLKPLIEKVEKDFETGLRSGVNRTPSFFINGEKFTDDWGDGQLLQYLKSMLIIKAGL